MQSFTLPAYLLEVCNVIKVTFLKELFLWDAKLMVAGCEEGVDVPHIRDL